MQLLNFFGAALLLALLMILPALVFRNELFKPVGNHKRCGRFAEQAGAVTVTYYARNNNGISINGSTTAPTATQASQLQKISATVVMGVTADVQALFTHNWGLDASAPGYFEPELLYVAPLSLNTYQAAFTFDWTNTNVLAINKVATDAPGKWLITLRRPHSIGQ